VGAWVESFKVVLFLWITKKQKALELAIQVPFNYVIFHLLRNFLICSKVSSLNTCSILQQSFSADSFETPSLIKKSLINKCFS
jgi:hypothetical protein